MASFVDNPSSFIHFGCWNQLNESVKPETVLVKISDNHTQPVEKVMETLTKMVKSEPPQFISVAGDNYYPKKVKSLEGKKEKKPKDSADEGSSVKSEKKKDKSEKSGKVKTIILDNLRRGFDLLKKVSDTVPIHVILGNHDLETGTEKDPLQIQVSEKGDIKEDTGDCTILTTEKEAAIHPPSNMTLSIHKTISDFGSNTLIFMIDTTVYSEDALKSENCYGKLEATPSTEGDTDVESQGSESHSSESRVEQIKREQLNEILSTIQSNPAKQNIVLIGHHPIIEYKQKKDVYQARIQCPGLVELWQEIVSENPDKNYYHLCADVHLYQEGDVTIPNKSGEPTGRHVTIHQYIVGTGGAELDPASMTTDTLSATSGTITVNYTMSQNISTYGLLKCTDTGGVLSFEFIPVNSTGGKRKTNRRTRRQRNKRRRSRRRRTTQN